MENKNLGNVHRSVSLPPDWWEAIEIAAASKGVAGTSISKWIADVIKEALPNDIMLTPKNGRGRPRLNVTKRPRAKPKVVVVVKTDWRKTCDLCRKNPKPEGGKLCKECQEKTMCSCNLFARLPGDHLCDGCRKFEDWKTANPE